MSTPEVVLATILVVVGLVWCFAGQRLYRMVVAIGGMLLGAGIAASLLEGQSDAVFYGGIIVAAVIIGFIFYSLYRFQVVLVGALVGITVGLLIISALNINDELLHTVILAVSAVAGTGLAFSLANIILRVGTAFVGAVMIVAGGLLYLGRGVVNAETRDVSFDLTQTETVIAGVVILLLAVIGFMVQRRTRPNDNPARRA